MKLLIKLDHLIEKICSASLVVSILTILLFSTLSIVFRWLHVNLMWIEPFVRHLVFLSTFLGGVVATGRGTHIAIDLVSKVLELKNLHAYQIWINRVIYLFSAFALLWLFKSGYDFTRVEFEFAKEEFLGISSGVLVAIIPFGMGLISFRFFLMFIKTFSAPVLNEEEVV